MIISETILFGLEPHCTFSVCLLPRKVQDEYLQSLTLKSNYSPFLCICPFSELLIQHRVTGSKAGDTLDKVPTLYRAKIMHTHNFRDQPIMLTNKPCYSTNMHYINVLKGTKYRINTCYRCSDKERMVDFSQLFSLKVHKCD